MWALRACLPLLLPLDSVWRVALAMEENRWAIVWDVLQAESSVQSGCWVYAAAGAVAVG